MEMGRGGGASTGSSGASAASAAGSGLPAGRHSRSRQPMRRWSQTKTPENGGRNGAISQWPARARCALAFRISRTVRGVSSVAVPNRRCLFGTKSSGVCGTGRRSGRPAGKIRPCRQLQLWLAAPPRPEWRERSRLCACRAHPLEPAAAAKRQRVLAIRQGCTRTQALSTRGGLLYAARLRAARPAVGSRVAAVGLSTLGRAH